MSKMVQTSKADRAGLTISSDWSTLTLFIYIKSTVKRGKRTFAPSGNERQISKLRKLAMGIYPMDNFWFNSCQKSPSSCQQPLQIITCFTHTNLAKSTAWILQPDNQRDVQEEGHRHCLDHKPYVVWTANPMLSGPQTHPDHKRYQDRKPDLVWTTSIIQTANQTSSGPQTWHRSGPQTQHL